jgi:hypothetical protein
VNIHSYNEDDPQLDQSAFNISKSGPLSKPSFISGRLPPKCFSVCQTGLKSLVDSHFLCFCFAFVLLFSVCYLQGFGLLAPQLPLKTLVRRHPGYYPIRGFPTVCFWIIAANRRFAVKVTKILSADLQICGWSSSPVVWLLERINTNLVHIFPRSIITLPPLNECHLLFPLGWDIREVRVDITIPFHTHHGWDRQRTSFSLPQTGLCKTSPCSMGGCVHLCTHRWLMESIQQPPSTRQREIILWARLRAGLLSSRPGSSPSERGRPRRRHQKRLQRSFNQLAAELTLFRRLATGSAVGASRLASQTSAGRITDGKRRPSLRAKAK